MDWTEAHRPRSLDDLVGNGPSVGKLRAWAASWREGVPKKRAVILAGPPGTGKTSAALALATDMGWTPIELNASDARNAERIRRVATAGALHQTFGADGSFHATGTDGGRKLIILDEADNLYERLSGENAAGGGSDLSDKGGKAQIVETIRQTRQPIVLIVNDLYGLTKGSGSALNGLAETLKFARVNVRSIPKALAAIAAAENVRVDREVLEAVAARAGGDLRAAVRDLESICSGREHVTVKDLGSLGQRDATHTVFDVVRHVLKGTELDKLRREALDVDATPEDLALWVDENLPREYKDPNDLVRGYEALSRADVFLGRTRRTQNYRLWGYAGELATGGVMVARQQKYRQFVPFGFPQYLMRMSRSRGARQRRDALAVALGRATHQSRRKARNHQVEAFERLFQADSEFAAEQTALLELSPDDVTLLLGDGAKAADVKVVMEAAQAIAEAHAQARGPEAPAPGGLGAFGNDDEDDGDEPDGDDDGGTGDGGDDAPAPTGDDKPKRPEPSAGQSTLF